MRALRKRFPTALALIVVALVGAGEADALVQRTFVSGLGSDSNPCTRTEPCRTFGAAIAQTQAGGEVVALDTAGFGPVTITKALSLISSPGVYAGITTTAADTDAVTVTAGANDVVVLRGLSLAGLGIGNDGIQFNSGKALRVDGLTISGFVNRGIGFGPSATARLLVTDSLIRGNGVSGIYAFASTGQLARVTIDRTRLLGNGYGVIAGNHSRLVVRDSVVTGNASAGFYAASTSAVFSLENCLASDNNWGIFSEGLVRVAGTTVSDNATGLAVSGGSILSRGNNTVEGNGTDGVFTATFAAK